MGRTLIVRALVLAVIALGLFAPAAYADTYQVALAPNGTCGTAAGTCGFTITYSVQDLGSGDFQMTFDFINSGYNGSFSGNYAGGYIQSMSLTALTGSVSGTPMVTAVPSISPMTVSVTGDSSGNNGNGNNCTGNVSGAICVQISGSNGTPLTGQGQEQSFVVLLHDSSGSIVVAPGTWNFKAQISSGAANNTSSLVALSDSGTPSLVTGNPPPPPPVPEPASMIMFGSGLVAVANMIRRRRQ